MGIRRIGLDIGGTAVRMAEVEFPNKQATVAGRGTLVGYAQAALPRGAVQNGEVRDVGAVSQAIKRAYSTGKFGGKEVILGVGSATVTVREMEVASLPMNELRTSLPFQVQEILPMSSDEAVLDFFPTAERESEGRKLLRGILVAAPKTVVSQSVLAVEGAGLRPVMVDLNAFALERAEITDETRGAVVAFVDIGAKVTTVIIVAHGTPRLVRSIPSGGQDVTDAIAKALSVSPEEAESLKASISVAAGGDQHPAQQIVAETSKALVESIRNTFVFYSGNNPGANISHVILSGGGSHLQGLGQYLATASRLAVSYGNAFARVNVGKKVPKDAVTHQETRAAIAVGLAFGEAS